MNKLKISIIGILMILALLVAATGCGKETAGNSSDAANSSSDVTNVSSGATSTETTSSEVSEDTAAKDSKTILGSWDTAWDMSGLFNMVLAFGDETMAEYVSIDELEFPMQFTFREDGTYTVSTDEEAVQATMNGKKEELRDGFTRYFEHLIEEEELNVTVDELLAGSYGVESMDEYLETMIGSFDDVSKAYETVGKWKIEDGKLYVTEEADGIEVNQYYTYTLSENELKLLELHMEDEEDGMEELFGELLGDLFPMVMTRAK